MRNTFGFLGELENVNLNNLRFKEHNGFFELNDPMFYRSLNNYPDDLHIINKLYFNQDDIIREVIHAGGDVKVTDEYVSNLGRERDRFLSAKKHLSGEENILTGMLEIHVSENEDFCMQRFYRSPDEMVFIRVWENNSWSEWTYENSEGLFMYNAAQNKLIMSERYVDDMVRHLAPRFDDRDARNRINNKVTLGEYNTKATRVHPDINGYMWFRDGDIISHGSIVLLEPSSLYGIRNDQHLRMITQTPGHMFVGVGSVQAVRMLGMDADGFVLSKPGYQSRIILEHEWNWQHKGNGRHVHFHDAWRYSEIGILINAYGWRNMVIIPITSFGYAFRPVAWFHKNTDPTITYHGHGNVQCSHYDMNVFAR